MCTPRSLPPSATVWIIFFMTSACLQLTMTGQVSRSSLTIFTLYRLAGMYWYPWRSWDVWVWLKSHSLVSMVLTNIIHHPLVLQWLAMLIIAKQPESWSLVIFVICDVQVIGSCLKNCVCFIITCYCCCCCCCYRRNLLESSLLENMLSVGLVKLSTF
jgi:hypothetical protein